MKRNNFGSRSLGAPPYSLRISRTSCSASQEINDVSFVTSAAELATVVSFTSLPTRAASLSRTVSSSARPRTTSKRVHFRQLPSKTASISSSVANARDGGKSVGSAGSPRVATFAKPSFPRPCSWSVEVCSATFPSFASASISSISSSISSSSS